MLFYDFLRTFAPDKEIDNGNTRCNIQAFRVVAGRRGDGADCPETGDYLQTNGTLAHITAIFGFMLAGLVIQDATKA